MEYIIIQPNAEHTSSGRAWLISQLLFDIVKHPTSTGTAYLFNVVEHPDGLQAALECDNAQEMPLQNEAPLALLVDELSDTIGIEEAAQWAESMIGNTVTFADLLPASITPKTWEQMNADGWFVVEETI
jgi:hypothetical protein